MLRFFAFLFVLSSGLAQAYALQKTQRLNLFDYTQEAYEADPQLAGTILSVTIPPSTGQCIKLDFQAYFGGTPTSDDCGAQSNRCSNPSVRSSGYNRVGFRGCISSKESGKTLTLSAANVRSMLTQLTTTDNACNVASRCCGLPTDSTYNRAISCLRVHNNNANTSPTENTIMLISCDSIECNLDSDSPGSIALTIFGGGCTDYTDC